MYLHSVKEWSNGKSQALIGKRLERLLHMLSVGCTSYFHILVKEWNFYVFLMFATALVNETNGFFAFRFSDLTGSDYSEGAIQLAQNLADRDGFPNIKFLV